MSHLQTKRKHGGKIWLFLAIVLLVAGIYLLINIFSPALPVPHSDAVQKKIQTTQPTVTGNRLYIPKISVDVAIVEGTSPAVLEQGAWHRHPKNGDPEKGGNFVLSAHRFQLGLTPQKTRAKSPFYHIDKLDPGDIIYVDYNKKRYKYTVTRKYKVDRNAVEIEAPSEEAKLTLYSCDLRGEAAGREVVEAKPLI